MSPLVCRLASLSRVSQLWKATADVQVSLTRSMRCSSSLYSKSSRAVARADIWCRLLLDPHFHSCMSSGRWNCTWHHSLFVSLLSFFEMSLAHAHFSTFPTSTKTTRCLRFCARRHSKVESRLSHYTHSRINAVETLSFSPVLVHLRVAGKRRAINHNQ